MILCFADVELDLLRYELRRDGERVPVEPQVFEVLVHLVRHNDRVVTKEELLDEVWGSRFVSESALTTRIKAARRAVGDDGSRQAVIRTVHGRGYRCVAPVTEVAADPGAPNLAQPTLEMRQEIRFCRSSDGVGLAYACHGQGPALLKVANWLTHLDHDWQSPLWRHWLRDLGRGHRLIRYDERGCGLSDRDVDDYSLDAWVRDLEAVVDDSGLNRFPLLGISQGAAVAIAYTVAHPDRVTHLVLYGAYARGLLAGDTTAQQQAQAKVLIDMARVGWGLRTSAFRQAFATAFMPEGTPEQWAAFDELQRQSTSPDNAVRFLETFFQLDVRHLAPEVRVPTLVLHCRGDQVWPLEDGRQLSAGIPGSRFVPLESRNHLLLEDEPAWSGFIEEIERFLAT